MKIDITGKLILVIAKFCVKLATRKTKIPRRDTNISFVSLHIFFLNTTLLPLSITFNMLAKRTNEINRPIRAGKAV